MEAALKLWHVKACPLFTELTQQQRDHIAKTVDMIELENKRVVPPPPADDPSLYIVKKGHVQLSFVDEEGHEAVVLVLGPGDVFGALTPEDQSAFGEHCRTIEGAVLCRIGRERFEALVRNFPDLAFRLTKLSFLRIRKLQVRLAEMMMKPAEVRLALALLDLSKQVGREMSDGRIKLTLPLSHADFGKLIGTSREMVSILLKKFRNQGLVESSKGWTYLRDVERLEELAGGDKPARSPA